MFSPPLGVSSIAQQGSDAGYSFSSCTFKKGGHSKPACFVEFDSMPTKCDQRN